MTSRRDAGEFSGILLAAGAGARFGGRKLLYPLPDGTPVGVAALRNLRQAAARVLVVIRAGDVELAARFAHEGARVLECADAALGMGHSLSAAVRAEADASGWVIALGDMPWVDPHTVGQVLAALVAGAQIVVPVYRGQQGHPVGFAESCRGALLRLQGDLGARSVLARARGAVTRLEVDDPGVLQDVDTLQDLLATARGPRRAVPE